MTNSNIRSVLFTFAISTLAFSGTSLAATATSNMDVSATVTNNCTISAGALAFGSYGIANVNGANLDASATITLQCTSGASTVITLGQGLHADTGSTDAAPLRRLESGTNHLSYALFSLADLSAVWGNTSGTGLAYTGVGSSSTVTVYGRIAGSQNVPAGSYTDTVVGTITF
jgi:spore coat protein U-like protein